MVIERHIAMQLNGQQIKEKKYVLVRIVIFMLTYLMMEAEILNYSRLQAGKMSL